VAGVLIHQDKVLLVKHKKLGIWLAPGGHVEGFELPHQAVERECLEESGLKARAVDPYVTLPSIESEYLPHPFLSNLHWISEDNYQARLASATPEQPQVTTKWPRGCEQHLCLVYLLELVGTAVFTQNAAETDDINWFTLDEVQHLETTPDIKSEVRLAFELVGKQA
jgi:ADP-ribose pyrophosphatase YjhB (NUDIX family)